MSLKNINYSPRFTKYLVASRAFEQEPLIIVDIGARGGFEQHWSLYGDEVKIIGFEADPEECERLNQQASNSGNRFFPVALHQNRGKKEFYVTAFPDSSGFYRADMEFWQRFPEELLFVVEKTIEIDTVDFDSFASKNHIDSVDFIKLDTEGSELDILKGAIKSLRSQVLGVSIEVEFFPVHKDQPVFSDVDSFMRQMGFCLFDLATCRLARKSLKPSYGISVDYGQILVGDALYLRDGVNEIDSSSSLEGGWDNIKVLKLASIMELFGLPDCAIELIQVGHRKGLLQGWDVDNLIDLLVPKCKGNTISYNKYLKNIIAPYGGDPFLRKVVLLVPSPIRHVIRDRFPKLRDLIVKILTWI